MYVPVSFVKTWLDVSRMGEERIDDGGKWLALNILFFRIISPRSYSRDRLTQLSQEGEKEPALQFLKTDGVFPVLVFCINDKWIK